MGTDIRYDEYKGNTQVRWQPPVRIQPGSSPLWQHCTPGPAMTVYTGVK